MLLLISLRSGSVFARSLVAVLMLSIVAACAMAADRERAEFLRGEIARHDDLYFRRGEPAISDAAYDALKREYAAMIAKLPELTDAGSLESIGDDRTGLFPSRRHGRPMLSLKKAYTEGDVRAFEASVVRRLGEESPAYVIEPKYDGVAINLVYEKGELVHALTRGNGIEGDDVTSTIVALTGVPTTLPARGDERIPQRVELRGEAFVMFEQFQRSNRDREEAGEPPHAHPRALAAGTVRLIDANERGRRELSLVVHGWGAWEPTATRPRSHPEFLRVLHGWGLPGTDASEAVPGGDALWDRILEVGARRATWAFPTDGVVVKVDATLTRDQLGEGTTAPSWALAVKFPSEQVMTRIVGITWQVGRSGVLTPVAELEPVSISGVTVARATLHSPAHLLRMGVRVGDTVEVERAGEVIPRILGVRMDKRASDATPMVIPRSCPSCATMLVEMNDGATLRCDHPACPARRLRRLEHFVSPAAVDIPGFGPALLEALIAAGVMRTPADLYRLTHDDLVRAGAGGGARRLLESVEASRGRELWRFIHGLGIQRIGAATARALADELDDLAALLGEPSVRENNAAAPINISAWAALDRHFSDPDNRAEVEALVAVGINPSRTKQGAISTGLLNGHTVVFTGKLAGLARDEAVGRVRAAGGKVSSAVSAKTTLVVAGEAAGAKLDEARRLGVRVVGEGEFRKILAGEIEN